MGETTSIEWTDSTFNPWIGCTKISPACDNCYAVSFGRRLGVTWGNHPRRRTSAANWKHLREWSADAPRFQRERGRRRRVFCASLADWLDNQVDKQWRYDFCSEIDETPELDYLLLSKRPQNYQKMVPVHWRDGPPRNVWLGITAEDRDHYVQRYTALARIPATVHFISYEPGTGAIGDPDIGAGRVPDWFISGGESGVARSRARMIPPNAVRALRDRCQQLGVAFFHKQWGNYGNNPLVLERGMSIADARAIDPDDGPRKNGKGGALLDGELWRQFPAAL